MSRVTLTRIELVQKLASSISLAFSRQSGLRRDLLNPSETEKAEHNRRGAELRLAEFIADQFHMAKHEVTRKAMSEDQEEILERLRESAARKRGE